MENVLAEKPALSNNAGEQKPVEKVVETPDYMAELKAKDDKIAQLQKDRDNYRTGMLKYKKQADGTNEEPTDEERFRQIAREELLNSELMREQSAKDDFIRRMAKENTELKTAIANKAQVSSMPGGASQPNDKITVEKLGAEQKAELEAKARELGIDPVKFVARAVEQLAKVK